ncbi:MAG: VOC family protein [Cyanobacteriota bacterium]|nr:VOC family protein [Cyanobacteriota bacterium]
METQSQAQNPTSDNNSASSAFDRLHLKRPCMAVADLERSLSLYRDILGFRLDYFDDASPNSYLYPVFGLPENARLKFAALSTESEARSLALTEVKGIELPPPTTPHRAAIVIQVPEVAPKIAKIRELGLPVVRSSTFTAPPNLRFTEQAFCDYDGHLIVLYDVKVDEDGE